MEFQASNSKRDKRALIIFSIFLIIFIPVFIIVQNDGNIFPDQENNIKEEEITSEDKD